MSVQELKCSHAAIVWFPDPSCVGGARGGREGSGG